MDWSLLASFYCLLGILCSHSASGIICWECDNAIGEAECQRTGKMTNCRVEQNMCQIQLRLGGWGKQPMIDKSCKTLTACGSNYMQNRRRAWAYRGEQIQCNSHYPSSVCRCCCDFDRCNHKTTKCNKHNSVSKCKSLYVPWQGWMKCTHHSNILSTCSFGCTGRGFYLKGKSQLTCDYFGKWNGEQPRCLRVSCPPKPQAPTYGTVHCTRGDKLGSRCLFSCEVGYKLDTVYSATECIENRILDEFGVWSRPSPKCIPLTCPEISPFHHGNVTCTNANFVGSRCKLQCESERGYVLHPPNLPEPFCQRNEQWKDRVPCCTLPCPPYAIMDFLVILDSSSSVGAKNWRTTKKFVKSFLERFKVQDDSSRYASFRYNREVDRKTQIFLDDFPNNKRDFLRAFDKINYNGNGTNTGNALTYAHDVMLARGNREKAKDVILLITDGTSQDNVTIPAQKLHDSDVTVYVVPVLPPSGRLDQGQILSIAGEPSHVLDDALVGGFEALDDVFSAKITRTLCHNPCTNPFHDHER